MSYEQQQQQQQQRNQQGVEDLANRLNQMNVYSPAQQEGQHQHYCQPNATRLAGSDLTNIHVQQQQQQPQAHLTVGGSEDDEMDLSGDAQENQDYQRPLPGSSEQRHQQQQQQQQTNQAKSGNILIVTNVDSSVFSDQLTRAKFESLFLAYDNQVTFRYLRSFRRVRLDFVDSQKAEHARQNLTSFKIGDTVCKCYIAQLIRPQSQLAANQQQQQYQDDNNSSSNYGNNLNGCYLSTQHLCIPKLTKQFLISPPASPPVGWEPVHEGSPCIDVQLLSAMANLVPGKVHEIHQGNESQPGIYVEVCEDPQFPATGAKRCHIPKTPLPVKPSF